MLDGFGQAPVCLELDLDSYDGPWTHVERFRGRSGWLVVAEADVTTAGAEWTTTLVAACDDYGEPVPAFMAPNLLACACSHPQPCRELPPTELDELLDDAAHELRLSWLRDTNRHLHDLSRAGADRIAAMEAVTRAAVDEADHRIADLRRRRRMPGVTPHAIGLFNEAITDIEINREATLHRLIEQRANVRRMIEQEELLLLRRVGVSVRWEPLYHVAWSAAGRVGEDELAVRDHIRSARAVGARFAYNARRTRDGDSVSLDALLAGRQTAAAKPLTPSPSPPKPEEFEHLLHRAATLAGEVAAEERIGLMLGRRYRIRVAALRREARALAESVNTGLAIAEPLRLLLVGVEGRLVEAETTIARHEGGGERKSAAVSRTATTAIITISVEAAPLAPVARSAASGRSNDGKLRIERAALARQLTELETTGRKFLSGSPKYERNRAQRAELAGRLQVLDTVLAEAADVI
jgi:hypothetical protein